MGRYGPKLDKQTQVYRKRFHVQRWHATNRRGIDWHLTFEEWLEWWGTDIVNRGSGHDDMCMCRYGDTGPYSLDNIYKDTHLNNSVDNQLKSVTVGTTVYESINACARAYNTSPNTVKARCNNDNFPHWSIK